MSIATIVTRTELSFYRRDKNSGDDIISININWENGDLNTLQANINTWLRSIKVPLKVVADKIEVLDPTTAQ